MASSRQGREVLLHVYDLGTEAKVQRINAVSRALGGGLYHTAIEVIGLSSGCEWSFGSVENDTGVFPCCARKNEMHTYRQTLSLGHTEISKEQWKSLIRRVEKEWHGSSYHLISRNCQCFCEAMALELSVSALPDWIRRFAHIAERFLKRAEAQREMPSGPRTQAAIDGLALLKRGAKARKFRSNGSSHLTTFILSDDERKLSWESAIFSKSIEMADVIECVPGVPPADALRVSSFAPEPPPAHLCLTLVMMGSLPAPPSAEETTVASTERHSLDLCCFDEEEFGYWLAAVRTLLAEHGAAAAATLASTAVPAQKGSFEALLKAPE